MGRIKEEPLTTQALNAFFKTMHEELDKTEMHPGTREGINVETIEQLLNFIDTTKREDPGSVFPIFNTKDAPPSRMMPTTLSDLRKRMETMTENFFAHDEETDEPTRALLKTITGKAMRAAEREMGKTDSAPVFRTPG